MSLYITKRGATGAALAKISRATGSSSTIGADLTEPMNVRAEKRVIIEESALKNMANVCECRKNVLER